MSDTPVQSSPVAGNETPAAGGGAATAARKPANKSGLKGLLPRRRSRIRVIPQTGVAGSALTAVIAVMCYLGSLALGLVIVIDKSVDSWTADISGQVTVQIKPLAGSDMERDLQTTLAILKATRGVTGARVISTRQSADLLEPWLGGSAFLKDLPIPRLIEVKIDRNRPPDFRALASTIAKNIPNAALDTHRRWQAQIVRSAGTMTWISIAVLILISMTTAAIVVFATRAAMAANRNTVEVLHLIGAHDNYIARLIQRYFLKLGLRSGILAGLLGAASFYALGYLGTQSGNPNFRGAAVHLISGPALLEPIDYLAFLLIPIAATLIAMITARLAILRILSHVL
jgi:cell division transport system permease protein